MATVPVAFGTLRVLDSTLAASEHYASWASTAAFRSVERRIATATEMFDTRRLTECASLRSEIWLEQPPLDQPGLQTG